MSACADVGKFHFTSSKARYFTIVRKKLFCSFAHYFTFCGSKTFHYMHLCPQKQCLSGKADVPSGRINQRLALRESSRRKSGERAVMHAKSPLRFSQKESLMWFENQSSSFISPSLTRPILRRIKSNTRERTAGSTKQTRIRPTQFITVTS